MENKKFKDFLLMSIGWPLATSGINDKESFLMEFLKYINMLEADKVCNSNINIDKLSNSVGFKEAQVKYNYWIEPNKDGHWIKQEKSFIVKSNDEDLTEIELCFQIHRESHPILKDQDSHYLEYLELIEENNNIPLYKMVLGS